MPTVDKHPHGHFCWLELHTSDRPAAAEFYSKLFGWDAQHTPMGPDMIYTMFQFRGRAHGAASGMLQPGEPPNWQLFVAVDSADEANAKAVALGAQSLMGVGDVGDFGRMAVLKDPQGGIVNLWQAKQHAGLGIQGEEGAYCWAEYYAADAAAAKQFYTALFGWKLKESPDYNEIYMNGRPGGGILQIKPEWGPMPPHWVPYFLVANAAAAVEKAEALGGKCVMQPMPLRGVGTIAMMSDPQGARFWLYEEEAEAA